MSEQVPTQDIWSDEYFTQHSLHALAENLARGPAQGYPAHHERLFITPDNDQPIVLEPGSWETSPQVVPTMDEQQQFAEQGLHLDNYGRPLHPWFWEMVHDDAIGTVTGKGDFLDWYWGPNYTADPVIIRHDQDEPHLLLITRRDREGLGELAIPGGFVDLGETALQAAVREAHEETKLDTSAFAGLAVQIYHGPVADPRITANAWPETTGFAIHLPNDMARHLPLVAYQPGAEDDEVVRAEWQPAAEALAKPWYGSHRLLGQRALDLS